MRIPINIKCPQCGRQLDIFIQLDEYQIKSTCECGMDISGALAGFTVGYKLLARSRYEFQRNSDYSLCIVFAATAMECELSRLYFKWTKLNISINDAWPEDQALEASLRSFSNIADKIENVSSLMYRSGIQDFLASQSELSEMIATRFDKIDLNNLATSFQKTLFWPRNRILHLGFTKYDSIEATYCYNTAALGLKILNSLDMHKINAT